MLAELAPGEPEVHGLVALMEIQASRLRARIGAGRGAHPAAGAEPRALGPATHPPRASPRCCAPSGSAGRPARTCCRPRSPPATPGPPSAGDTDWARIVALYELLAQLMPTPGGGAQPRGRRGHGLRPAAGLELVDALTAEPALSGYHLLPSVRGDLLARLGRHEEARAEFERAASLTRNARERAVLLDRAAACPPGAGTPDG